MTQLSIQDALADFDRKIVDVIAEALKAPVSSVSNLDGIVTGNAYQTVRLGETVLPGFRADNHELLVGVPLAGRRFVDLGCNLGEHLRMAVAAGAVYAEGLEYEPYFVRIASLINAYNDIHNVVVRQADLMDPNCLQGKFEVGACFSSYVYVRRNLDAILPHITELFLLETHSLDDGWVSQYLDRVTPILPYWALCGLTGAGGAEQARPRAFLVFGRQSHVVEDVIGRRCASPEDAKALRVNLDMDKSQRPAGFWGETGKSRALFAELREKLSAIAEPSEADVAETVRGYVEPLKKLCAAREDAKTVFATDLYWLSLLEGLVAFFDDGAMAPTNPYLIYMQALSRAGNYDPGMSYALSDEARAIERLTPRLARVMEVLRTRTLNDPLITYNPLKVPVLTELGYDPTPREIRDHITIESGDEYKIQYLDGNHRLAVMWLSGAKLCTTLLVWTNIFSDAYRPIKGLDDEAAAGVLKKALAQTVLTLRA